MSIALECVLVLADRYREMLNYGVDPLFGDASSGLGFRVLSRMKLPYAEMDGAGSLRYFCKFPGSVSGNSGRYNPPPGPGFHGFKGNCVKGC